MNICDKLNRELLINNGFVYRRRGWYRRTEDFLQIINFQKSYWGNQYYINIGEDLVSMNTNGSIIYPPENQFHLRGRVEDITVSDDSLDCLDFENSMIESERMHKMTSLIDNCISFLNRIQKKDGLKQEYKSSDNLNNFMIYSNILSIIEE